MCLERVFTNKNTTFLEKVSRVAWVSKRFPICSTVKERCVIYLLSLPLKNGKIRADFYGDCQDVPDPSSLGHMQKNLLLLGDCFLGKQNKAEAYYTRGRPNNCGYDIRCPKLFPITSTCNSRKFKLYYTVPTRRKESHTYPRWPLC